MTALTASQAIAPAIERTRNFLFDRFRWLTFLKLSLVAIVTEGVSIRLRYTLAHANAAPAVSKAAPADFFSHWMWLIGLVIVLGLPIAVFALYIVTRLRFAFFHCLTHNTTQIRPAWILYGQQAMRLFEAMLAVWAVFVLLAFSFLYPLFNRYLKVHTPSGSTGLSDFATALSFALSGFFTVFFLFAVIWLADTILHDFLLPHMALEKLTLAQAWNEWLLRASSDPRAFSAYFGQRFILPIIGFMLFSIGAAVIGGILSALAAAPVASLQAIVHSGSVVTAVLAAIVLLVLGILGAAIAIFVSICLGGPLAVWIRNYALLFYGGYYQPLGDLLTPAPVTHEVLPPPSVPDSAAPPVL